MREIFRCRAPPGSLVERSISALPEWSRVEIRGRHFCVDTVERGARAREGRVSGSGLPWEGEKAAVP